MLADGKRTQSAATFTGSRPSEVQAMASGIDGTTLCFQEKLSIRVTSLDFYEEENMLVVGLVQGGIILMKINIEPAPMFGSDKVMLADEKN
jgi:hypothetical protein